MLEIRTANEHDLSNIVQLYGKIWRQNNREAAMRLGEPSDPDMPRARQLWGNYLHSPQKGLYVAYDETTFLGYTSYHKEEYPEKHYSLSTIYIADHTRSEEVYRGFIKVNAANARSLDYRKMFIHVDGKERELKSIIADMGAQHEYDQGMCWSCSEVWSWSNLERLK